MVKISISGFVLLLLMVNGIYASNNVSRELEETKNIFGTGKYIKTSLSGINALDMVFQIIVEKMTGFIPELSGFTTLETNSYYSFSDENGSFHYSVIINRLLTNTGAKNYLPLSRVLMTLDLSLSSLEHYNNIITSWEFLTSRGDYFLLSNRVWNTNYFSILEKNTLNLPIIIEQNNDIVVSGLLLKMEMLFSGQTYTSDKEKIITNLTQEIIQKLPVKSIKMYLK